MRTISFLAVGFASLLVISGSPGAQPASTATDELIDPGIAEVSSLPQEVLDEHPEATWFAMSASGDILASTDEELIQEPVSPPTDGSVSPFLIDDPLAWAACFVDRNPDYTLASATHWGNSSGPQIKRIKCGDTTFGWHHIQMEHESHWQDRINQVPGATGNWDDLMAFTAKNAIEWPLVDVARPSNNTRCVSAPTLMYDADGDYVYTFNPSIVFATNNDRVITAIPTTSTHC